MNFPYPNKEFNLEKSSFKFPLTCVTCNNIFYREKRFILQSLQERRRTIKCCSRKCRDKQREKRVTVNCANCNTSFEKLNGEFKKSTNHFCSRSCNVIYQNNHKIKGVRRSKLEIWLENKLIETFPLLDFKFNDKTIINSELDIFIPSLKLAFELNGHLHFSSIFGDEKFLKIINNDKKKKKLCVDKNIELYIINTSNQVKFKPESSEVFYEEIVKIINQKL